MAPVLSELGLSHHASDTGVEAVLSQQGNGKLHPCALFPCRLSPSVNYDTGDRELLAIKVTLEEGIHWAEQPFIAWMDYKNVANF